MVKLFVSEDSVIKSIEYFKNLNIPNHMHLGIFLFLKYFKIDIDNEITDQVYKVDRKGLTTLYLLGGIFDNGENPRKRTCLFPFAFTGEIINSCYYNGGTEFGALLGRIKDTLDNTLVDHYVKRTYRSHLKSDVYSLDYGYLKNVEGYLSNSGKIDLSQLASWTYRFTHIEVSDEWSYDIDKYKENFTRILTKKLLEDFNLNEEEKNRIFKKSSILILPNTKPISGSKLRSQFKFDSNAVPVIDKTTKNESYTKNIIVKKKSMELSMAIGKNLDNESIKELLEYKKQVILFGPPGTGKTFVANKIATDYYPDRHELIQFHPSYSYEDFIGGYKISPSQGDPIFKPEEGILLSLTDRASENDSRKFLLIIDEINRGNLPKILGEAIIALERKYEVKLNFENRVLKIPDNLHILGTMNSADRNIALVDYALRRRFTFVRFYPNYEIIESMSDISNLDGIKPNRLLEAINDSLMDNIKDQDLLLGQSYFMPDWAIENEKIIWKKETLQKVFNHTVLPLLEEYTYGNTAMLVNIVGKRLAERINDETEFIAQIKARFPLCFEV